LCSTARAVPAPILDRFRPPWERGQGSTPWHWILDETGAYIVAEQLGIERKELNWRRASALAIAASAKLRHHIEVNEFFSRLASEAATQGGALAEWYGERTTQRLFQGRVTPDGYGCCTSRAEHRCTYCSSSIEPLSPSSDYTGRRHGMPRSYRAAFYPMLPW
jgi:hypothetical protein